MNLGRNVPATVRVAVRLYWYLLELWKQQALDPENDEDWEEDDDYPFEKEYDDENGDLEFATRVLQAARRHGEISIDTFCVIMRYIDAHEGHKITPNTLRELLKLLSKGWSYTLSDEEVDYLVECYA